ncbi:hypothetical protein TNCV_3278351 [Trichonephila clavipes]|nr:hypothetical protein TNCV_3278351 [Trichonephila clavipes]
MDAIDFLHHENPPTWGGVEPPTLCVQAQRLANGYKKRSGRASTVKTKVVNEETALQRSPLKRPSVIITEFISLLNSDERYLGCNKMVQRVTHHGAVWKI